MTTNCDPTEFIPCPHRKKEDNPKRYDKLLRLGEGFLLLCPACYGEIVVQVIDELKTVKIQLSQQ